MGVKATLQSFNISNESFVIYVPDPHTIQHCYADNKEDAYWSQVWPAAIGLCNFLQEHPGYITNKSVLELAAGLGLPGLISAAKAKQVCITERAAEAIVFIKQSAAHHHLHNITCSAMDWHDAVNMTLPDTLLISDLNYDPAQFEALQNVINYFLAMGVVVIISTPQRLMAKVFINYLMPFNKLQRNYKVSLHGKETEVSVFVLHQAAHFVASC